MSRRTPRQELADLLEPGAAESAQPTTTRLDPCPLSVAELLARYHRGEYVTSRPAVHRRLTEIFRENPPDALDLLAKAADHLGVTGERAASLLDDMPARRLEAWEHG